MIESIKARIRCDKCHAAWISVPYHPGWGEDISDFDAAGWTYVPNEEITETATTRHCCPKCSRHKE